MNIYQPKNFKIIKIIDETPNIKTFVLKPLNGDKFTFQTGQFIELTVYGVGEAPFTPSSSPYHTETIDVTIMRVGRMTEVLHSMKKGDVVGIRGPYGKGYPVDSFVGKQVLIIGGGVGLAPLRSLLLTLIERISEFKKIILCYGARTPQDIVYKYLFPEWSKIKGIEILRSVDKCQPGEWDETVGVVTCLLDKIDIDVKDTVAVVCGPPIMMKFTTLKLIDKKFKPEQIYLSMERNMSCGLGKCGH
ncbi:MAG: FAD/NAD(P)-binding protein, partial [Endomicrobia bacterium]|nr:FAD/NAD(P)-binding protein [Endomicrobiia bacterium]